MNRACSDKEEALMRKHGLIFFYEKLGWKIIAEKKKTQQCVKRVAA